MRVLFPVAFTVCLCLGVASVSAHHGPNGNATEGVELTGRVEQPLRFMQPHAKMGLRVDEELWELTVPASARFVGLDEDTIPVGATVTIVGRPNLDPDHHEIAVDRVEVSGRVFELTPRGLR